MTEQQEPTRSPNPEPTRVAVDPSQPTCGDVCSDEGACILPHGHEGKHWHSMFGEPRS